MSIDEDDESAGLPLMVPHGVREPSTCRGDTNPDSFGRNSLDEALPLATRSEYFSISEEERIRRAQQKVDESELRQLEQYREDQLNSDGKRAIAAILRLVGSILLIIVGAASFLIWNQTLYTMALITSWPYWLRAIGVTGLLICGSLVVGSVGYFLFWTLRYRRMKVVLGRIIDERRYARRLVSEEHVRAIELLNRYLHEYRLENDNTWLLRLCGMKATEIDKLRLCRDRLLTRKGLTEDVAWLNAFSVSFQKPIDQAATQVIKEYAKLTALKTMICPYSLLDMLVVIYMGTSMIGLLCRLYNLQPGLFGKIYLLGAVVAEALFAGRLDEQSEEAADWLSTSMVSFAEQTGHALPDLAANVLGKVTASAGQGAANGFLIYRIGRQACKMLRPLECQNQS